jgi:carboxymethylenebutenolidase
MSAIVEDTMRIPVGTRSIEAHFIRPTGAGPYPGILLLMELYGVRSWLLADARDLATEGYVVLVPNLYSGTGALRFCLRQFFTQAALVNANETRQAALREVFTVLEHLKTLPAVDAERLGTLGQCLTGGFALHLARRSDVKAPVVYHHSLGVTGAGIDPADAAEIRQVI